MNDPDLLAKRLRSLDVPGPDPARVTASVLRVAPGQVAPTPRWRLPARLMLGLGTVAMALVALLGLRLLTGDAGHRAAVAMSSRDIMLAAAAKQDASPVPSGRWWHTETRMYGVTAVQLVPRGFSPGPPGVVVTERWIGSSPEDGAWVSGFGPTGTMIPVHRYDVNGNGRVFFIEGRSESLTDLEQLPTGHAALRTFLLAPYPEDYRQQHPVAFTQRLFGEAFELTLAPVRPAVRAEVFRILAELPGTHPLSKMKDPLGREAVGIGIEEAGVDHQLLIDPRTGSVLGIQDAPVRRSASPPAAKPANVVRIPTQMIVSAGWTNRPPAG